MGAIEAHFHGNLGRFSLDVEFAAPASGVTGIFGPSGCGKTTILRCLAGLNRFAGSRLRMDGEVWQDANVFLPPHRRPIGYVFQEPRLFAHLSVRGNLLYGFKRAAAKAEKLTLERVAELMGIDGFLSRSVYGLSGGEQQRIAIARALLSQPRLLLMDEPLSALDKASRNDIMPYLETLHRTLRLPIVYVTHDFAEIERLADHLILMQPGGKIAAAGPLTDLTSDMSLSIAAEPEAASILDVAVGGYDEVFDITDCVTGSVVFQAPGNLGNVGDRRRLRICASDVSLVKGARPAGCSLLNILEAEIVDLMPMSRSQTMVLLAPVGAPPRLRLMSSITRKSCEALKIAPGDRVFAQVKSMALAGSH